MKRMKSTIVSSMLAMLIAVDACAGGWTNWATPTQIDVVGTDSALAPAGLMIYGTFGNVGNCTQSDRIFIPASHGQYNEILAAALSANISGRRIRGYVSSCTPHLWYSNTSITYDFVDDGGAVNFGN
jgi:hypothetical protein